MAAGAGLTCPACDGELAPWRSIPGGEPADSGTYELLRCRACGTVVTAAPAPPPTAYESGQYSPRPPRARRLVDALQDWMAGQPARWLRRAGLPAGARVLDVGAGQGRLVERLRRAGAEARGIDPSGRSVALALQAGRAVERRGLYDHSDSDLDAVALWHVLEHLDDTPAALSTVRAWLRPGGLLLVGVPNAASLQARIGDGGWLHWDVPRHRVHFTAKGIVALLERSGFEVVRTHHFVLEQNLHGMWMALLTRLGMRPGFPFHFLKRNIEARPRDLAISVLGLPLLPVAILLEAVAAGLRRGGTVAIVARAR